MLTKKMDFKAFAILAFGLICLGIIGCSSMLDRVTPCEIPKQSLRYVEFDPNEFIYPTLSTAQAIRNDVIIKHRTEQINLLRLAQDDKFAYADAIGFIEIAIADSQAFQDLMVGSQDQPMSILGILAGAGIGLPLGLLKKRKGDYTPEEFEVALAKANGNGGTKGLA